MCEDMNGHHEAQLHWQQRSLGHNDQPVFVTVFSYFQCDPTPMISPMTALVSAPRFLGMAIPKRKSKAPKVHKSNNPG